MIVGKRANHASLALHESDFVGRDRILNRCGLVDSAQKLVAEINLKCEARHSLIKPMVVGAPCAVVELVETCVVPVLTDESLVGTEFLEVPELAGVYTGAAVVDGDVGVVVYTGDSQSGINLGEVIVILQTVGKVGALARVLRSDVEVAHAGCSSDSQCGTGENGIFYFIQFHDFIAFWILERSYHTERHGDRTWIDVLVDTGEYLGIKTVVLGNHERILHGSVKAEA